MHLRAEPAQNGILLALGLSIVAVAACGGLASREGGGKADSGDPVFLRQVSWSGPVNRIEAATANPGWDGGFVSIAISGQSTIAGTRLEPPPGEQSVIVKIDDELNALWVHLIEQGSGSVTQSSIAGDPAGGVDFVAALRRGLPVDVGGGPVTTAGSDRFIVGALDAGGAYRFSWIPECSHYCGADEIAVDSAGNVALGGQFSGVLTIGGKALDGGSDQQAGWVGLFDAQGNAKWLQYFGSGRVHGLHFGGDGRIVVLGHCVGGGSIGGLPIRAAADGDAAFLVALDSADGHGLWATTFGLDQPSYVFELAGAGAYVGFPIYRFGSAGFLPEQGVDVLSFAAATGKSSWQVHVSAAVAVAMSADDHAIIAGVAHQAVTLGSQRTNVIPGDDFVAALGTDGGLRWVRDLGAAATSSYVFTTATHRAIVVRLPTSDGGVGTLSLSAFAGG